MSTDNIELVQRVEKAVADVATDAARAETEYQDYKDALTARVGLLTQSSLESARRLSAEFLAEVEAALREKCAEAGKPADRIPRQITLTLAERLRPRWEERLASYAATRERETLEAQKKDPAWKGLIGTPAAHQPPIIR